MLKVEPRVLKKVSGAEMYSSLRLKSSLSEIFHENTKLTPLQGRLYGKHIAQVLRSRHIRHLIANPGKVYTLMDQVELRPIEGQNELERTIVSRRSSRDFTGEPLTLEEISRLLYFSYGKTDPEGQFRAVASGGAVYPLEIYLIPHQITGLDSGIYHYNVDRHVLDVVKQGEVWGALKECLSLQDMRDPDTAAAVLVVTAVFRRCTLKYLDRGYRLVLMEAGEVGQNLSLMSTSLGLGGYMLGGFYDDALCQVLGIDGLDEAPLLPMVFGRRPGLETAPARS